jgi:hypothetical protein
MIEAVKLHAAVDAAIDRLLGGEESRRHLGASVLGKECARRIWYDWHWVLREKFIPRMLRLFNRGHETEPRFFHWLRAAGITVWEAGESGEMKAQMRIAFGDGHGGGTPDGVGKGCPDLPSMDIPFLIEAKTHNEKSFNKLLKDGIMRTKWEHFVQMQLYMHFLELKWALYCAINKNDDQTRYELVQYDEREALRAIKRGETIIWTKEPPSRIAKSISDYRCDYCHFKRLCWFGDVTPLRNCRTCIYGAPIPGGNWACGMDGHELNEAAQRAGCSSYQVNPQLKQSA